MFFFFNQKTAYEMRISDWSSDVCSSDLGPGLARGTPCQAIGGPVGRGHGPDAGRRAERRRHGRMTRRGSKPLPPTASAGMVQALAAPYKGGPLSREERREFEASKARQRVLDEQARAPHPALLDREGAPGEPTSPTSPPA